MPFIARFLENQVGRICERMSGCRAHQIHPRRGLLQREGVALLSHSLSFRDGEAAFARPVRVAMVLRAIASYG